MSENGCRKNWASESKVAKYRVLMAQTRDPVRVHMLQDMIDRELAPIATTVSSDNENRIDAANACRYLD